MSVTVSSFTESGTTLISFKYMSLGEINLGQLDVSSKFYCLCLKWTTYTASNNPQDNQQHLYYTPTTCDLPYYSINKRTNTNSEITNNTFVMYTANSWQTGYTTCWITTHSHPVNRLERSLQHQRLKRWPLFPIGALTSHLPQPPLNPHWIHDHCWDGDLEDWM